MLSGWKERRDRRRAESEAKHLANEAKRKAHGGYPVEKADCARCHDPHASDRKGLLRASVHPPMAEASCDACHQPADSATPFALTAAAGELCAVCHDTQELKAGVESCTARVERDQAVRGSDQHPLSQRRRSRLRRHGHRRRLHDQEPERDVHLRLRPVLLRRLT